MAQLMPLPLTVSCFSKSQIGFTFLVPVHMVVPEKGPLNGCVCVCVVYAGEMGPHDTALEREHFGRSDDQTVPHRRSKMPVCSVCTVLSRVYVTVRRPSVCVFVPLFAHYTPLLRVCHCVLCGRKYRSIAARPALSSSGATAAVISSKCEQCYVYS